MVQDDRVARAESHVSASIPRDTEAPLDHMAHGKTVSHLLRMVKTGCEIVSCFCFACPIFGKQGRVLSTRNWNRSQYYVEPVLLWGMQRPEIE